MAKLRDAHTSEIVFEGSPLECVVHARELGGATLAPELEPGADWECPTELIYDDVGLGFDPDLVLQAAQENASGLAGAARDQKLDKDERKRLAAAARDAEDALKPDATALGDANAALEEARQRQDRALAAEG